MGTHYISASLTTATVVLGAMPAGVGTLQTAVNRKAGRIAPHHDIA